MGAGRLVIGTVAAVLTIHALATADRHVAVVRDVDEVHQEFAAFAGITETRTMALASGTCNRSLVITSAGSFRVTSI